MAMFLGINFISLGKWCVESTDKTSLSTMHYFPQKSYNQRYYIGFPYIKKLGESYRGYYIT